MWIYAQKSGRLWHDSDPETVYQGYAGYHEGRNNPDLQHEAGLGPIPRGLYEIGSPYTSELHGPYVLRLTPAPENDMGGRSGFLIHGVSAGHPMDSSRGCICISRQARTAIWLSDDHQLHVIAGEDPNA